MKNNLTLFQKVSEDIKESKYWVHQFKKVLRQAKEYGLNEYEIKQGGNDIKKYRLKIKQLESIINKTGKY